MQNDIFAVFVWQRYFGDHRGTDRRYVGPEKTDEQAVGRSDLWIDTLTLPACGEATSLKGISNHTGRGN
jgi:hypothetical protein